jgi:hypothetical protein
MEKLTGFVARRTQAVKQKNNQGQLVRLFEEFAGFYDT